MTHEDLEETVSLYAVGALERVERQALEAHLLSGCVSCHTSLKEYQSATAILPFGLNLTAPPHSLKEKIMDGRRPAAATEPTSPRAPKTRLEPGKWMDHVIPPETGSGLVSVGAIWKVALLAILLVGGYQAWEAADTLMTDKTQLTELRATMDAAQVKLSALQEQLSERDQSLAKIQDELQHRTSDLEELKDQLTQRDSQLEDLQARLSQRSGRLALTPQHELATLLRLPNAKAISLPGTEHAKQAVGMVLYDDRAQKVWFYSVNLPECPIGTTYQLWAIQEKPISVGLFRVSGGMSTVLLTKPLASVDSATHFSVSLEPRGGRPEPTGQLFLESQL